jgi:hypothetical protein
VNTEATGRVILHPSVLSLELEGVTPKVITFAEGDEVAVTLADRGHEVEHHALVRGGAMEREVGE